MHRSTPTARQAWRSDTWYASAPSARARGERRASSFFSERLVEDRLVQAQVRHQPFQLAILLSELAQFPELAHPQGTEALSPAIKALLANAQLATDLPDRGAVFRLQRHRDLLVGELTRLHPPVLPCPPASRGWWDRSLAQNAGPGGLISGEDCPRIALKPIDEMAHESRHGNSVIRSNCQLSIPRDRD